MQHSYMLALVPLRPLPDGGTCELCGWRRPTSGELINYYVTGGVNCPYGPACRRRRSVLARMYYDGTIQATYGVGVTLMACPTCMFLMHNRVFYDCMVNYDNDHVY